MFKIILCNIKLILYTKKVVGYSVISKTCRKCDVATKSVNTVSDHDCRKNWGDSSKAMKLAAMTVNYIIF